MKQEFVGNYIKLLTPFRINGLKAISKDPIDEFKITHVYFCRPFKVSLVFFNLVSFITAFILYFNDVSLDDTK